MKGMSAWMLSSSLGFLPHNIPADRRVVNFFSCPIV
jgi:hypothetical protein